MKRLTAVLVALPTLAMAHAGDHIGLSLTHLMTESDHMALIAALVAVVALVIYKLRSRP